MSGRLSHELGQHASRAIADNGGWLMGVPAIVADNQDPEHQHRVRVIIPSIDENEIFDEWAKQLIFCLGDGYGSSFIPPKGSEVVLFGRLGMKYSLYYGSVYNEEMTVPPNFDDETNVGFRVPGNLTLIAAAIAKVQAQNIELIATELARMTGQNAHVIAGELARLSGSTVEVTASGQLNVQGGTLSMNSDGAVTIHGGGNVNITATGTLKLEGRTVNKTGPSI